MHVDMRNYSLFMMLVNATFAAHGLSRKFITKWCHIARVSISVMCVCVSIYYEMLKILKIVKVVPPLNLARELF